MREIPLTQGKMALVDDADYEKVSAYRWRVFKGRNTLYAAANARIDGRRRTLLMHRLLLNLGADAVADHRDLNGLNNQRGNLRVATRSQNCINTPRRRKVSPYRGVQPDGARWRAVIQVDGKAHRLGGFADAESAARAYDAAARKYHGEFARLNFA